MSCQIYGNNLRCIPEVTESFGLRKIVFEGTDIGSIAGRGLDGSTSYLAPGYLDNSNLFGGVGCSSNSQDT